jgi:hypothetical protein
MSGKIKHPRARALEVAKELTLALRPLGLEYLQPKDRV